MGVGRMLQSETFEVSHEPEVRLLSEGKAWPSADSFSCTDQDKDVAT